MVIGSKEPRDVIKAIHKEWCMDVGFLTMGFWSDNSGEFRKSLW